jgi:hypothetical protein
MQAHVTDSRGRVLSSRKRLSESGLVDVAKSDACLRKMPVEVSNPIAFDQNPEHASYDPEHANRLWRILVRTDEVFKEFRSSSARAAR